jgi:hypothetical protein
MKMTKKDIRDEDTKEMQKMLQQKKNSKQVKTLFVLYHRFIKTLYSIHKIC